MNVKPTTPDEQEAARAYVRAVNARVTEKLRKIDEKKDAIQILRKEIRSDIKAATAVADRHGFTIGSLTQNAPEA